MIAFRSRRAFWCGVAAITAGVGLHLPMFLGARAMHYRLVGMSPDPPMLIGMALIVVGLGLAVVGLLANSPSHAGDANAGPMVRALDDAPLNSAHVALIIALALAVTIDVMKPTTLGFVMPGMAREYGLKGPTSPHGSLPVALLPLAGIAGTVVGSLVWGALADRLGRCAAILLTSLLFIATSICGAMPSYQWNLAMCFVMGLGVGGMIPVAFTLLSETIPASHRGWIMVLIGGDAAGAYFISSWLASALTPEFGWRSLWFVGVPTGLLLVVLNRWIPESPRFLIAHGRFAEAYRILARYGAVTDDPVARQPGARPHPEPGRSNRYVRALPGRRRRRIAAVLGVLGVGVGLITFGFQLWLPSDLQSLGFGEVRSDEILRDAALLGFPSTFLIAILYARWSTCKTLALTGLLTAASLLGIVVARRTIVSDQALLYALLVIPLASTSSLLAAATTYCAEIYPTPARARGSGLLAAATKAGGVLIIAMVAAGAVAPSIAWTAALGAVPVGAAALLLGLAAVETRGRSLEDIATDPYVAV